MLESGVDRRPTARTPLSASSTATGTCACARATASRRGARLRLPGLRADLPRAQLARDQAHPALSRPARRAAGEADDLLRRPAGRESRAPRAATGELERDPRRPLPRRPRSCPAAGRKWKGRFRVLRAASGTRVGVGWATRAFVSAAAADRASTFVRPPSVAPAGQLRVLAGQHLRQVDHHAALLPRRVVLHLAVDHVHAAAVGDRLDDLLGEGDLVGVGGEDLAGDVELGGCSDQAPTQPIR